MTDRGYVRISLDTERSGSIEKQRQQLARYSAGVEIYADQGVSGSKVAFASRPGGAQLLAHLGAGDRVLVTKIDRAARNVRDLLELVETVERRGASILFVEQGIDTAGAMGKFFLTVIGAIAELEAGMIGERRRESLAVMREQGRHGVGAAPFGFRSVENPDARGLVIRPHPVYGPLVARAAMQVAAGATHKAAREALLDALNALPDPVDVDPRPLTFSPSGFRHLLENPRLAGMTPRHGFDDVVREDGGTSHRQRIDVVSIAGMPLIDTEAALISMAEWHKLQEALAKGKGRAWSVAPGYGAALICSECGERLYRSKVSKGRPAATYACARVKHAAGSRAVSVSAARADAFVEDAFLSRWGSAPHLTTIAVQPSMLKLEAEAVASTRIVTAQRDLLEATTEEAEDAAVEVLRAAKAALKDARGMPGKRAVVRIESGRTQAEEWISASDPERCVMLRLAATWTVYPGHIPVAGKIRTSDPGGVEIAAVDGGAVIVQADGRLPEPFSVEFIRYADSGTPNNLD